jgi:hypothetical protein
MLRTLDKVYFRLKDAWSIVTGRDDLLRTYQEGYVQGVENAGARIIRELESREPRDFSNQHFKLGYYYATEIGKKVIHNGNRDDLA